ncbi:MAG: hypothetical protein WAV20_07135 [Blastocatellia bacterium]
MRDTHIIKMLEENAFDSLKPDELATAESHIGGCDECNSAYSAARVAASLIKARTAEAIDVGPFFKTRVMASVRERGLSPEVPALVRMWRAAGALVSAMVVLVVILAGMTLSWQRPDSQTVAASQSLFSPEYVMLERGDPDDDELATDQVVATIYDLEDGDGQ